MNVHYVRSENADLIWPLLGGGGSPTWNLVIIATPDFLEVVEDGWIIFDGDHPR